MKTIFKMIFAILLMSEITQAQCFPQSLVQKPQTPNPCAIGRASRPYPVSYVNLREADIMWSKRIWRTIDLREKLNLPMYYPTEPKVCLMSLFDVLKCAILESNLTAFANPAFDDEFTTPMTKEEV